MPGMYQPKEYDLAGFAVGAVKMDELIDGKSITPGDTLIALPSSGVHSNGFSLVRAILAKSGAALSSRGHCCCNCGFAPRSVSLEVAFRDDVTAALRASWPALLWGTQSKGGSLVRTIRVKPGAAHCCVGCVWGGSTICSDTPSCLCPAVSTDAQRPLLWRSLQHQVPLHSYALVLAASPSTRRPTLVTCQATAQAIICILAVCS